MKRKARKPITFPVMEVKMVLASKVIANDYNPNKVSPQEMELLARSIEEDGFTQPVVTCYDKKSDLYIVVDGFHRFTILKDWFGCQEIPVVVIHKDIKERMAATVRHNRARGKHTVDLMVDLVTGLLEKGWNDIDIAKQLGMEAEEVLRLKAQTGYASLFKKREYSRSWDEMPDPVKDDHE
jgi:ParB-like chromosome segregation protein Spo0J